MNFRRTLLIATSAALLSIAPAIASAQISVRIGPPARRFERVPPARRGFVWIPGYNRWDGRAYVWVPGEYRRPPNPRARWYAGEWRHERGGYVWHEGRWR
jgi:hypothetical protein